MATDISEELIIKLRQLRTNDTKKFYNILSTFDNSLLLLNDALQYCNASHDEVMLGGADKPINH